MTPQKKITTSKTVVNDDAEISFKGHIDVLMIEKNTIPIDKNIKATYVFKVFSDPSDIARPARKTAILTCDIDWGALGIDKNVPIDWSWSSRNVTIQTERTNNTTAYGVVYGRKPVAMVAPNAQLNDKASNLVVIYPSRFQLTGLRQGMHIDDVARQVQSEIPGTRVVLTGRKNKGLTEYVLLSYGEDKVYDVTGDYHYQLNNNEPYFTFWTDSKNKLVKWFKLKEN